MDDLTKENLLIERRIEGEEYEILKLNLSSAKEKVLFKGNFRVRLDSIRSGRSRRMNNLAISDNGSFLFTKTIKRTVNSQELFFWNQETEKVEKVAVVSEPTQLRNFIISQNGKRIAYLTGSKDECYYTHWEGAHLHIMDINGENKIEIDLLEAGFFEFAKTMDTPVNYPYVSELLLKTFLDQDKLLISRSVGWAGIDRRRSELLILNPKEKKIEKIISYRSFLDYMKSDTRQLLLVTGLAHGSSCEHYANYGCGIITEIIDLVKGKAIVLIDEYELYDNEHESVFYHIRNGWFLENTDSVLLTESCWGLCREDNLILFDFDEESLSAQERFRKKSDFSVTYSIFSFLSPSLLLVNEDGNLIVYDFKRGGKRQIFNKNGSLVGVY